MSIVDLLEVIQVDEHNSEFIIESSRAINFRFKGLIKMPGIVEPRAVVSDGQLLNSFDGARVFDGDGGVVAQRLQKERFLIAEVIHIHIYELDDTQDTEPRSQGHADDRLRLQLCHLVNPLGEARIFQYIGYDDLLAMFGDMASNPFADFKSNIFQGFRSAADGNGEIEFVALFVDHQ